ncbi:MAG: TonB-dependent receptor [Chitinophagaceae bacterium]|nr:TonB-dependent receptor [Chitinophagaceae bacterium]
MRQKLLFSLLIISVTAIPQLLNAQATVTGTVKGKGTALQGATVSAKPTGRGASTDDDGKYKLTLPAGTYVLSFTSAGFSLQTVNVTLANGDNKTVDVDLAEDVKGLEDVVVVGSRSLPRTSVSTPLPVDVLSAADLRSTAQPSFDKQLQYRVPSFNTVNTPVNDATTLLDPYEIRGLGPSRTLILINGKRKNLSSLLYVQFAPGRGETGADLAAIPVDAIKRVEILRDGASAQYGSDAIAGVMNIILKDKYQYSSLTLNSGVTSKGDGATYGLAFNSGSNFGTGGFVNYTLDISQQNNAIRSGIIHRPTEKFIFGGSPAADAAIDAYLNRFPTGNNLNGTGEVTAAKFNVNFGIPVGNGGQFYGNAGYVNKKAISNANFRTPYWRTDAGLLHVRIPGAPNYTGGSNPLYEGYLGYMPSFEGDLSDYHATLGFKTNKGGWVHDMSFTTGGNQQLYTVENTVNRTLGTRSPTTFKPGGYRFSHVVGNYDISKTFSEQFSLAFGTEVRRETYEIIAGDTASYSGEGANSFPGIRAENASVNNRFNFGAYADATFNVNENFLINGAIRGEKYSDFGDAFVWKLSSRYKLADNKVTIRASVSTGFRAPTLHQIYAQSTQASFVAGTIQLSGLFNNRSKQAFLLGVPKLNPEKSTNFTVGLGLNPVKNLNITLDYYSIRIKDRIFYSSAISSGSPGSPLDQILQAAGVVQAQFFLNGLETETSGLDFVLNYKGISLGKGKLAVNVAGNYVLTNKIIGAPNDPPAIKAEGKTTLSAQIRSLLTEGRPLYKAVLGFDYQINKWAISLNNTLFGTTRFQDLDNGTNYSDFGITVSGNPNVMNNIKQIFKPAVVTDLNVRYDIKSNVSFSVGINNLLNVLPKWRLEAIDGYAPAQTLLNNQANRDLLEGLLSFSGRYRILGYNGSQFSQLGTIFNASLVFRF